MVSRTSIFFPNSCCIRDHLDHQLSILDEVIDDRKTSLGEKFINVCTWGARNVIAGRRIVLLTDPKDQKAKYYNMGPREAGFLTRCISVVALFALTPFAYIASFFVQMKNPPLNVGSRDKFTFEASPLYDAIQSEDLEKINFLLQNNVNTRTDGESLRYYNSSLRAGISYYSNHPVITKNNRKEIILQLLKKRIDFLTKDYATGSLHELITFLVNNQMGKSLEFLKEKNLLLIVKNENSTIIRSYFRSGSAQSWAMEPIFRESLSYERYNSVSKSLKSEELLNIYKKWLGNSQKIT